MGSCHTVDAAYGLLYDLKESREAALAAADANKLRHQAKKLDINRALDSKDEATILRAKADLMDWEHNEKHIQTLYDAAVAELDFITECMKRLEPHRKFAHLPLAEAFEAAQEEEWKLEFIKRAENNLLTNGRIPTDDFAAMRRHPAFKTEILPAITQMRLVLSKPDGPERLLEKQAIPLLMLEHKDAI